MSWLLTLLLVYPAATLVQEPEATSLLGRPLPRLTFSDTRRAELQQQLEQARAELARRPDDVEALIWVGRRLAYLGRYQEAIEVYSRGLRRHPDEPRLLRHRGHRYLSIRRLEQAEADLRRAAELIEGQPNQVEPDGQPNRLNQPRSSLHFNVYYHLGLARHLQGEYRSAMEAYRRCLEVSDNDDVRVATVYWSVLTLWRLGEEKAARELLGAIRPEMDIIENDSYHRLLLLFKGSLQAEELDSGGDALQGATQAYGVASWHRYNGRPARAESICRQVLESPQWSAFGYLACEAELARR